MKDGKRDNNSGHISNKQDSHLQNVWNTFNFNTIRGFHKEGCFIITRCI